MIKVCVKLETALTWRSLTVAQNYPGIKPGGSLNPKCHKVNSGKLGRKETQGSIERTGADIYGLPLR